MTGLHKFGRSVRVWRILPLVMFITACAASPSVPPSTGSDAPGQQTTPAPIVVSDGTLTLTIFSPTNQAVVSDSLLEIHGAVTIDSILKINNVTYILAPGEFTQTIDLDEGQNSILITAESLLGFNVELTLTVTYQP